MIPGFPGNLSPLDRDLAFRLDAGMASFPTCAFALGRQQVGAHHVVNVHEIPLLAPIIVDHRRPAREHAWNEGRDHRCVGRVRPLPRAADVEVAETNSWQSVNPVKKQSRR